MVEWIERSRLAPEPDRSRSRNLDVLDETPSSANRVRWSAPSCSRLTSSVPEAVWRKDLRSSG
jgi:hypothetical protein